MIDKIQTLTSTERQKLEAYLDRLLMERWPDPRPGDIMYLPDGIRAVVASEDGGGLRGYQIDGGSGYQMNLYKAAQVKPVRSILDFCPSSFVVQNVRSLVYGGPPTEEYDTRLDAVPFGTVVLIPGRFLPLVVTSADTDRDVWVTGARTHAYFQPDQMVKVLGVVE